ncbi:MAG TPA: lipid-A-disaccharide synthase [Gammaproteobacteria bacterium]|nr:lipid-A-disaccharide synthase [Gammaproteobacteria bacterium]
MALVAGESSGDYLAAGLLRELRRRSPCPVLAEGVAGPRMQAEGCRTLVDLERLSVMGVVEVLRHLPGLLAIRRRLRRHFLEHPPDVFIGVDSPEFNLGLEARLHRGGIRTVHYVSPSVWAWRPGRVHTIARAVDRILTLLPFEADFYREHRVAVSFVGHPLADEIPLQVDHAAAREALGENAPGSLVAVLPGSRLGEIGTLAEPFLATVRWLAEQRPGIRFVAPMATPRVRAAFEEALARSGGTDLPLRLVDGRAREVLAAADAAMLACGTAALEAMLLKCPMIAAYRVSPLTYVLLKKTGLVRIDRYALPNFLTGEPLVPEFIQGDVEPQRMGETLLRMLDDTDRRTRLRESFARAHEMLKRNASARAAEAVLQVAGLPAG